MKTERLHLSAITDRRYALRLQSFSLHPAAPTYIRAKNWVIGVRSRGETNMYALPYFGPHRLPAPPRRAFPTRWTGICSSHPSALRRRPEKKPPCSASTVISPMPETSIRHLPTAGRKRTPEVTTMGRLPPGTCIRTVAKRSCL